MLVYSLISAFFSGLVLSEPCFLHFHLIPPMLMLHLCFPPQSPFPLFPLSSSLSLSADLIFLSFPASLPLFPLENHQTMKEAEFSSAMSEKMRGEKNNKALSYLFLLTHSSLHFSSPHTFLSACISQLFVLCNCFYLFLTPDQKVLSHCIWFSNAIILCVCLSLTLCVPVSEM